MRRRPRRDRQAKRKVSRQGRRGDWLVLGAILLVGLVLRGAYLSELVQKPDFDSPLSDAKYNDYWARGLATGDWSPPTGESDPQIPSTPYFRPPGYPYFLASIYLVAGTGCLAPRMVQMALGLASCVLSYLLGRAVFGRTVGLIGAGLVSVYWVFIYFEGELQPPALLVLLTLLLMTALHLWAVRPTYVRAVAGGLLFGLLAVVRPNVLLFLPVLLVWTWWVLHRRNAGRRFPLTALGTAGALALTIAPVTIRNYAVARDFVLISTNGGINLYIGNNEHTSLVTPRIPDMERLAGRAGWNVFSYGEIVRGVERQTQQSMKHSEVSRYFTKRALDFIRSHPARVLGYAVRRAALLWGPKEVSNNKVLHYERKRSATLRFIPGFAAVASGFLVGLLVWLFDRRAARQQGPPAEPVADPRSEMLVLILLFVVTYSSSFLSFLVAGRFRVPLIPYLLLFAAYALYRLGQFVAARKVRPAALCVVGWLVLYLLARQSFVPYRPDLGTWYFDRATAYNQKGELDRAITEYRAAVQANPNFPDVYAALGSALATRGDFDHAIANYRKAIELNPSFAELRRKLAALLDHLDRLDEAIEEYRAALRVSPNNAEAWYYLGRALMRRQSNNEAMAAFRTALEVDPNATEARVNLGVLLQGRGRIEEAIREYRQALHIDPNLFEAHFNLASALAAQGDIDQAFQELSIALHIRPNHPAALSALKGLQAERQKLKTSPTKSSDGDRP
ncbi:MAG: tetratricopeptide repeat protein [Phycisphaerae bacterium]